MKSFSAGFVPGLSTAVTGACAILAYQTFRVTNDDAFITFTYARNLAIGRGFVFNQGERVLGTTTPLWAMLLSTAHFSTGIEIPELARIGVIVCLTVASLLLVRLLKSERTMYVGCFLPITLFFNQSVAWGLGNEIPLLILTVTSSLYLYRSGRVRWAFLLAVLAYLVRGEGILIGLIIAGHYAWTRRGFPKAADFAFAATALLAWHAFAFAYFGSLLPNTFGAKTSIWGSNPTWPAADVAQMFTVWRRLPSVAYAISQLGEQGFVFGLLLAIGVAIVAATEPLVVVFVGAQLLGYSLLGARGHEWYFYSLGWLWALSLACGCALLVKRVFQRHSDASRGVAVLGVVLVLLTTTARFRQPEAGDLARYHSYKQVAEYLAPRLKPTDAIIAQEIGVLGYSLRTAVADPDFLVHKRGQVQASQAMPYLVGKYDPTFFVTTEAFSRGSVRQEYRFGLLDYRQRCFRLAELTDGYRVGVYRRGECSP